jgi:hypothetical protein
MFGAEIDRQFQDLLNTLLASVPPTVACCAYLLRSTFRQLFCHLVFECKSYATETALSQSATSSSPLPTAQIFGGYCASCDAFQKLQLTMMDGIKLLLLVTAGSWGREILMKVRSAPA